MLGLTNLEAFDSFLVKQRKNEKRKVFISEDKDKMDNLNLSRYKILDE